MTIDIKPEYIDQLLTLAGKAVVVLQSFVGLIKAVKSLFDRKR